MVRKKLTGVGPFRKQNRELFWHRCKGLLALRKVLLHREVALRVHLEMILAKLSPLLLLLFVCLPVVLQRLLSQLRLTEYRGRKTLSNSQRQVQVHREMVPMVLMLQRLLPHHLLNLWLLRCLLSHLLLRNRFPHRTKMFLRRLCLRRLCLRRLGLRRRQQEGWELTTPGGCTRLASVELWSQRDAGNGSGRG